MEASAEGLRALWISLTVLAATAVLQAIVVAFSGSVALLGDTLHNAADALTAVPLAVAFVIGRRPPTRRYTYGYGRAEDLAGVVIVLIIAASSALAAYEAVSRLAHPQPGDFSRAGRHVGDPRRPCRAPDMADQIPLLSPSTCLVWSCGNPQFGGDTTALGGSRKPFGPCSYLGVPLAHVSGRGTP